MTILLSYFVHTSGTFAKWRLVVSSTLYREAIQLPKFSFCITWYHPILLIERWLDFSVRLTVTFLKVCERLINVYFIFGVTSLIHGQEQLLLDWGFTIIPGVRPLCRRRGLLLLERQVSFCILLTLKFYFECHSMEMPSVLLHSCIRLHEQKRGKPKFKESTPVRHAIPMFDPKKVLQSSNW